MKIAFGPKVVLHPSFGVTLKEIRDKIKGIYFYFIFETIYNIFTGELKITPESTFAVKGNAELKNIKVDGVLKLEGNGLNNKLYMYIHLNRHF